MFKISKEARTGILAIVALVIVIVGYNYLKGQNLLDEEARDHSSFIKDLAPRVGRNFLAGIRYTF